MSVIEEGARKVDRAALTFLLEGKGGGTFRNAVLGVLTDNADKLPTPVNALQITEIAELAQQQDDDLFCRLINNNVNLRYTNNSGTVGNIAGILQAVATSMLIFEHKDFNGGGMEQEQNQMYFMSNKCGVYRVSFGMLFDITAGVDTTDFGVYLIRKDANGSATSNPYSCVLWRGIGQVNKFWANGCDLIELECGDSVGIALRDGAVAGISAGNYLLTAWIAINYTGNQH